MLPQPVCRVPGRVSCLCSRSPFGSPKAPQTQPTIWGHHRLLNLCLVRMRAVSLAENCGALVQVSDFLETVKAKPTKPESLCAHMHFSWYEWICSLPQNLKGGHDSKQVKYWSIKQTHAPQWLTSVWRFPDCPVPLSHPLHSGAPGPPRHLLLPRQYMLLLTAGQAHASPSILNVLALLAAKKISLKTKPDLPGEARLGPLPHAHLCSQHDT